MKLRWMFALVALMVIAAGVILAMTMREVSSQWTVYIVEGIMVFCLVVLLLFYRTSMRLVRSVSNGMDLLREQDFSSRLAHVNQREADRIVDVFNRMMDSLKMIAIVTHVADARSCVLHPASHTHRQMNDTELMEAGVQPDLIRFSVGIENIEDIIADLEQALLNV